MSIARHCGGATCVLIGVLTLAGFAQEGDLQLLAKQAKAEGRKEINAET